MSRYIQFLLVHVNSVGANGSSFGEMQDANILHLTLFICLLVSLGIGGTSDIISNSVGLGFFSYNIREPIPQLCVRPMVIFGKVFY